jgi:hypothetical protein
MGTLRPVAVSVALKVGETEIEIGTVEVPFTSRKTNLSEDGAAHFELLVDQTAFRHRVCDLLHSALSNLEREGAPDGS